MKILTLNCGSSSVKYSMWEMPGSIPLCQGIVQRVGLGESVISHRVAGNAEHLMEHECTDHQSAIELILSLITDADKGIIRSLEEIGAVAHRVVHGGEKYLNSILLDDDVLNAIEQYAILAPLHNPVNLIGIQIVHRVLPEIPHTVSWDTSFSAANMPPHARVYAIPYEFYQDYGIRRYGYQGLSHSYVAKRAAALMKRKRSDVNLVSLHIGNGSTVTAVEKGLPIDQSLGFSTAGEGLVMGTRSGDLDPFVPLYLMRHAKMTIDEVENMMYRKSGVLGLTGEFVDRRDVIDAAQSGDDRAKLALDVECYRLKKYIGAFGAILGRIDALVFTAGVGESSPLHREKSCEGLEFMGIKIDKEKNLSAVGSIGENDISTPNSLVRVFVIPTDEELVMAEDAFAIIGGRFDPEDFVYSFEEPDYVPSYLRFSQARSSK